MVNLYLPNVHSWILFHVNVLDVLHLLRMNEEVPREFS